MKTRDHLTIAGAFRQTYAIGMVKFMRCFCFEKQQ